MTQWAEIVNDVIKGLSTTDNGGTPVSDDAELDDSWVNGKLVKNEEIKEKREAILEIYELESQQTPRRLREAALGDEDSIEFLRGLENEISELRRKL